MINEESNDPVQRLILALQSVGKKNGHEARTILVAIATAIAAAPALAEKRCENDYTLFPIQYPLGNVKHYTAEERFIMALDDLGLPCHWAYYTNKYPYAVLESDDLLLRLKRLKKRSDNPKTSVYPQLRRHVPNQMLLMPELAGTLPQQLQSWIVFGYERKNESKAKFIEARFTNSKGLFVSDTLNLLDLVKEPQAPQQEPDAGVTDTPLRQRRKGQQLGS